MQNSCILSRMNKCVILLVFIFASTSVFSGKMKCKEQIALNGAFQSLLQTDSLKIGLVPTWADEYAEEVSCDSCRWLSSNGVEFYLDQFFIDFFDSTLHVKNAEFLPPETPLIHAGKLSISQWIDSLDFQLNSVFDSWAGQIVYRPRDRFTTQKTKKKLSKLAGMVDASHLFLPVKVKVYVQPVKKTIAKGKLNFSMYAALWNQNLSAVELIFRVQCAGKKVDLNTNWGKWFPDSFKKLPKMVKKGLKEGPK